MYTQFTIKHLQDYLQSIFDYYILKYKLKCTLTFHSLYFNNKRYRACTRFKNLYFDIPAILNGDSLPFELQQRGYSFNNNFELLLLIFLHEIKHLIDRKSIQVEYILGMEDIEHNARPCEKRADNFANCEAKKWL